MRHDLPCAPSADIAHAVDRTPATDTWVEEHPPSLTLKVWVGTDGRTLNSARFAPNINEAIERVRGAYVTVEVAEIESALSELGAAALSLMLMADGLLKMAAQESGKLPQAGEAAAS